MTNSEDKHKWYVVRAITGQEKKVKHNVEVELERDNKLSYVPEILIPTEKVYQVKNGKKVIKERNAFPGYILVRADFSDPEIMPLIKSVSGVVGFLGILAAFLLIDESQPTLYKIAFPLAGLCGAASLCCRA